MNFKKREITVEHPEHGSVTVTATEKLGAMKQAAKIWGLQWSAAARECAFYEGGKRI